jgi:methanogenic corrinoid protein MtbC1
MDRAALVEALVAGDRDAALRCAEKRASTADSQALYRELFAPAMREVGELWADGTISVAQEHLASGLMEELLARDYARVFERPRASRETVLMACVEGERHVLGLRMSANLLEGAGFRVAFLGADTPNADIASVADRHRASAVVLAGYGASRATSLGSAAAAVRDGRVLIGGSAAAAVEPLPAGVTAVGDLADIVDAVHGALG